MTHTAEYTVLVSDPLSPPGLDLLQQHAQVDVRLGLKPSELIAIIPNYDALIVRSETKVTSAVLAAAKRLRVVARAGVGVDNIDVPAATAAGVIVANAPTGNVVAAAEHTVALLLALARNVPQADASMRRGEWKRSAYMGVEVRGKTLGTLGLGRVASEVSQRAQGLGLRVIAYDPYVASEYAANLGVELTDLASVLRQADFLTVHLPLTPETRNLIAAAELAATRPGVRILNAARGGIINEQDLLAAIDAGQVAGAALDVFAQEPPAVDSPLLYHPKIIVTPHIAGSTTEAQEQVALDAAQQVIDVLAGGSARYAVNTPLIPPRNLEALSPYIDLAERMGRFITQLGGTQLENLIVTAAGPIADLAGDMAYLKAAAIKGLLANKVEERVNLINAAAVAARRGIQVSVRKESDAERYDNLLTLSIGQRGHTTSVTGSMLKGEPYIVGIDDLWVEFPASGSLLLTRHHDRPGIIGRVGMLLGENDINISFMHVGRRSPRGEAIMVLGVDEAIPPTLFEKITAVGDTYWVRAVQL